MTTAKRNCAPIDSPFFMRSIGLRGVLLVRLAACLPVTVTGCVVAKMGGDTTTDVDSGETSTLEPDLPAPAECAPPDLPAFADNGCNDPEDRVALESTLSVDPPLEQVDGEYIETAFRLSCIVDAVAMSPTCNQIDFTISCDDDGVVRQYQFGFVSNLGPELALAPGALVEYEVDSAYEFECCTWATSRISDADGIVLARAFVRDALDHPMTDDVVAQAFAELGGRRTAPICSTDDDAAHEYALELTIGGETVTIPDDTALDVGGYRVLVERARSLEATADTPVAQVFDAIVMRTTG